MQSMSTSVISTHENVVCAEHLSPACLSSRFLSAVLPNFLFLCEIQAWFRLFRFLSFLSIRGIYRRKEAGPLLSWISYSGMGAVYANFSISPPEFLVFL